MKKSIKLLTLVLVLVTVFGSISVMAMTPYSTYTYTLEGKYAASPDAYTPTAVYDSVALGLSVALDTPRDLFVSEDETIYIADPKNNRIVVLDKYYKYRFQINSFVNDQGVPDALTNPNGVFVNDEYIYVADTDNSRIVLFDHEGNFQKFIEKPQSEVFPEGSLYKPVALAVDNGGRVYVVSSTTYMGIISITPTGEFEGFVGAQQVNVSVLDLLWRKFQTKEQRALSQSYVSTEYNNITIDDAGFIYVTSSSIDPVKQQESVTDNSSSNAPVKKLNTSGNDIMRRTGFFGPHGEVEVSGVGALSGASVIVDVALGPEGTWSIIDEKRSKVYTYDEAGQLMFIFGDQGMQEGNMASCQAIAYKGTDILILDKSSNNITVFKRTEYGDLLLQALANHRNRKYDVATDDWFSIMQRNANYDEAYIGIGQAYLRDADYEGAMDYFRRAADTENYTLAFSQWRMGWIKKYAIVIPIVLVLAFIVYSTFFKYAGKINRKGQTKVGRRTFWEEIMYGFWVIFHPFDGFWDLKREHRGSVRGAFFYAGMTIIAFAHKTSGSSYLSNPTPKQVDLISTVLSIMVPYLLWCAANWCLTTLFDGEGSFKDIFIATGYSLVPIPMFMIPITLCTHCLTSSEMNLLSVFLTISFVWTGLLIVFGTMVTHDYSFGKNLLMCIATIVGMAFIMFLGVLFSGLASNIASFVSAIVVEFSYRV
ncbi:MAG: YIP1 family protein [Clostridia bacterium]|nr:YIP1 family protein [Clostridia bacterium]